MLLGVFIGAYIGIVDGRKISRKKQSQKMDAKSGRKPKIESLVDVPKYLFFTNANEYVKIHNKCRAVKW